MQISGSKSFARWLACSPFAPFTPFTPFTPLHSLRSLCSFHPLCSLHPLHSLCPLRSLCPSFTPFADMMSLLKPPWDLRKPPAHSPCSPLPPEHLWVPGTSLGPQEAPNLLPLFPACSPCSQLAPLTPLMTTYSA